MLTLVPIRILYHVILRVWFRTSVNFMIRDVDENTDNGNIPCEFVCDMILV